MRGGPIRIQTKADRLDRPFFVLTRDRKTAIVPWWESSALLEISQRIGEGIRGSSQQLEAALEAALRRNTT